MAAYAALVSLINSIQQVMSHPHFSNSFHKKLIQPLQEKADFLLDFIEGQRYDGGSKEAEDLERQMASAANAAEDVIESHIVDQIHVGSNQSSLTMDSAAVRKVALFGKKETGDNLAPDIRRVWHDLQQIIQDMDGIMKRANEFNEEQGMGKEKTTRSRLVMETRESSGMVGFDEELTQLLDELTGQRSNRHIISIVGMGGIGKTTLAKTIYNNLLIKQHFDIHAWATISQQYKVEDILSQLISSHGKSSDVKSVQLGLQLHKTLSGRRYLIILDDVWSVQVWDRVKLFFPDNGNGSRVVLTTRMSNVAKECGSSCFTMNLLDEDKSWKLFREKAFQHEDCPPHLQKIGKDIVKLCRGLPLSIVVIGGSLLKSPRNIGYWKDFARDIKSSPNSREKQESLDVLYSSYNHLPPHLKPCFLYTGVFKCGFSSIPVSKIIQLWVAEGFIKPNGARLLEEIAEDYLKDLVNRNLILVGKRHDDGKIKSCDVHDLLRDLCLQVGEQQDFVHVTRAGIRGTKRRLMFDLMFDRSMSETRYVLVKQRLLRVLNLGYSNTPEESFGCVNLRYLAFKYKKDLQLPTSLCLPWNLQTLIIDIQHSKAVVAPTEIWKMRQLRHVECGLIYVPDPCLSEGQDGFLMLENLQTLKTAVNFRLCLEVCKIIPNIKKMHLLYDHSLKGYDDSLIECLSNLNGLQTLESLKLRIKGSKNAVADTKVNKILTFPNSLNKLSLSGCELHWDDLRMIGSLPQLEVLKLEMHSVMAGEHWSPIEGQFLRLKLLKIDSCDLVCWNADSSHFPVLEKIVLHNLWSLKEIPWGIGEITTLELIRLDRCPQSAEISAIKIKVELESQGNDDLQIQIKIFDSDLDSFREMVETEGLPISNVQLEVY